MRRHASTRGRVLHAWRAQVERTQGLARILTRIGVRLSALVFDAWRKETLKTLALSERVSELYGAALEWRVRTALRRWADDGGAAARRKDAAMEAVARKMRGARRR